MGLVIALGVSASALPVGAASSGLSILDCQKTKQVYDIQLQKCVADALATQDPQTATNLMLPMLGIHGTIIADADLAESVDNQLGDAATSDDTSDSKKDDKKTATDNTCSNGAYFDGCEDGTKRLCSLIPAADLAAADYSSVIDLGLLLGAVWVVRTLSLRLRHCRRKSTS